MLRTLFLTLLLTLSLFGAQWTKLQTATASSAVTMTLDPTTKGSSVVLSGGNLTTTSSAIGYQNNNTYSSASVNAGKFYAEVTVLSSARAVGISTVNNYQTYEFSYIASGFSYFFNATKYNNGTASSYGVGFASGDIIGILYDSTNGQLSFEKNGANQGVAYVLPVNSAVYLALNTYALSSGFTVNFGATPFVYPIPSGYKAWGAQ